MGKVSWVARHLFFQRYSGRLRRINSSVFFLILFVLFQENLENTKTLGDELCFALVEDEFIGTSRGISRLSRRSHS